MPATRKLEDIEGRLKEHLYDPLQGEERDRRSRKHRSPYHEALYCHFCPRLHCSQTARISENAASKIYSKAQRPTGVRIQPAALPPGFWTPAGSAPAWQDGAT